MSDRAAAARAARTAKAEARSVSRFDSLTSHYGQKGIGYPDGVWFLATSENTVPTLEKMALSLEDPAWPWLCLDAVGPIVGKQQIRPHIYIQIRQKYIQVWLDERGQIRSGVDDLLEISLMEIGIKLEQELRFRDEVTDIRRWA